MKTCKTYRFSPRTIEAIKKLKEMYPNWTETELIEAAIQTKAAEEERIQKELDDGDT